MDRHTGKLADQMPEQLADMLARFAVCALVKEVELTPKPGLVDRISNGAHTDMDLVLFLTSSAALFPSFRACAMAGLTMFDSPPQTPLDESALIRLVSALRSIGKQGEDAMFCATRGVNTHKGANYSFSLLLAATGMELARGTQLPFDATAIAHMLAQTQVLGNAIFSHDLTKLDQRIHDTQTDVGSSYYAELSHGEQLYVKRGITGVRGQSAAGYPALAQTVLPDLRSMCDHDATDALLRVMVHLMATLEDTNVLHRGGADSLIWLQRRAAEIHKAHLSHRDLVEALKDFDEECIQRMLSPGGTADMVSLGIYCGFLEGILD